MNQVLNMNTPPPAGPRHGRDERPLRETKSLLARVVLTFLLVPALAAAVTSCADSAPSSPRDFADAALDQSTKDGTVDSPADAGVETSDPTPSCVPRTCVQIGANCGSAPDGCGDKIECGTCPGGQICGGGGANKCGTDECFPKSCVQVNAQCGWASDGCSKAIDCGGCAPPESCGAAGDENACGCMPKTCAQLEANCGTLPDGCLGTIDCGDCTGALLCGGGGQNVCGTNACQSKTCTQLGASCGFVSDGCSQALDCGACNAPHVCGGGGLLNQCGCTPKTCAQLGASCGTVDTGCGDANCGDCTPPDTCGGNHVDNQCGCACTLAHATTRCVAGTCSIDVCDPGWENCDSVSENGCEQPIDTDVLNCGSCGMSCGFANATALCVGGVCQLDACATDFADCNANPSDGCEANLEVNPEHCNACGNACPSLGGTPVCIDGACDVSNCTAGLGDCDPGTPGCETDTTTSVDHCGYCGNPCIFANASAECIASTCHLAACNAGWGNCDANASNGCETHTDIAVNHCGACGSSCPSRPHATSTCASGTCDFTCDGGWADCDGIPGNGCETNVQTDVNHCGSCPSLCDPNHATPSCVNGSCTVETCDAGWGDCNANVSDGCETDLASTVASCGACGSSCSSAHGVPSCTNGSCSIACATLWGNCNGNVSDGCETSLSSDTSNCGSCGTTCTTIFGSPSCTTGLCSSACGVQGGKSIQLVDRQVALNQSPEAAVDAPGGYVITGVGIRVNSDNVVTLRVRVQPLLAQGDLGPAQELRAGNDPTGPIEANVDLPSCYVLVGFGARADTNTAKTLRLWAAPMAADGTLGPVSTFNGGPEPGGNVEAVYNAPGARTVTGVGFRVSSGNVSGLRAVTDGWQVQ